MENDRGEIVKSIIKQSGYSLAVLSKRLLISRGTLYNRLSKKKLSYRFIRDIGYVIGFDFAIIFPALREQSNMLCDGAMSEKDEYIMLLERYNDLLALATQTLMKVDTPEVRKKIANFIQCKVSSEESYLSKKTNHG